MSDTLWPLAKTIVAEALERPEAERTALVDERCAGRLDLKREVESLLDAHTARRPIHRRAIRALALRGCRMTTKARRRYVPGAEVGSYRLLKEIGRGGMGTVYLAERADRGVRQARGDQDRRRPRGPARVDPAISRRAADPGHARSPQHRPRARRRSHRRRPAVRRHGIRGWHGRSTCTVGNVSWRSASG